MFVVTLGVGGAMQAPPDVVWQTWRISGSAVSPVSAENVMLPGAPTLALATANAPAADGPGRCTMPSLVVVAPRAMTSGTGALEAESEKVLTPTMNGTEPTFAHEKLSRRSAG